MPPTTFVFLNSDGTVNACPAHHGNDKRPQNLEMLYRASVAFVVHRGHAECIKNRYGENADVDQLSDAQLIASILRRQLSDEARIKLLSDATESWCTDCGRELEGLGDYCHCENDE